MHLFRISYETKKIICPFMKVNGRHIEKKKHPPSSLFSRQSTLINRRAPPSPQPLVHLVEDWHPTPPIRMEQIDFSQCQRHIKTLFTVPFPFE